MLVYFAAAMILATMGLSVLTWFKLTGLIDERSRMRTQMLEWTEFYSLIKDAETGQRGFLLTGDDNFLQPFDKALSSLPKHLKTLVAMEEKDRREISTTDVVRLAQLVDRKLEELKLVAELRRQQGLEAAAAKVAEGKGKSIMDEIRTLFEVRSIKLESSIAQITEVLATDLRWSFISVMATSLSGLLAGAVSWVMVRRADAQARREERLTAEKRRAEMADREKSAFLATMSHEIRTPMNAILGFGELLVEEAATDKEKRYAQSIVRSGNSLLQIINDILDLSKIEAGMMDILPEATDVRELASFVQLLFAHQIENRPVEIRVEIQEDVPTSLMLDSARLRQILINLVGNALKFTDQGHVTLRFSGRYPSDGRSRFALVIEVEDTGSGIHPDKLQEIFKPFVQARERREIEVRGTGLGLAIVKRLTELMDGDISVRSTPQVGSVFRVDFPEVEVSARLPQSMTAEEPNVDFDDLEASHILVVDDNPINRELVRSFFEKTRHQISEAVDGQAAVDFILANRPDVVLMDIRMPVMDGRAALKHIRQEHGMDLLPVIAVTASSMAGEEGALRESFSGYVRKPFSRALLYRELAQFIPKRKVGEMAELAEATEAAMDEPAPSAWVPLVAALRRIETAQWPAVRDGMVLSEVQAFAATLADLAVRHECPPLTEYAAKISSQVDDYALMELEKNLASFAIRISEWERRLPSGHDSQLP